MERSLLHSSRAACFHKLNQFRNCLREARDALKMDAHNAKAWVWKAAAISRLYASFPLAARSMACAAHHLAGAAGALSGLSGWSDSTDVTKVRWAVLRAASCKLLTTHPELIRSGKAPGSTRRRFSCSKALRWLGLAPFASFTTSLCMRLAP